MHLEEKASTLDKDESNLLLVSALPSQFNGYPMAEGI